MRMNKFHIDLIDSFPVYKVQILVRATGKSIDDKFYNSLGASIWLGRIAKKHGYWEHEVKISKPIKMLS